MIRAESTELQSQQRAQGQTDTVDSPRLVVVPGLPDASTGQRTSQSQPRGREAEAVEWSLASGGLSRDCADKHTLHLWNSLFFLVVSAVRSRGLSLLSLLPVIYATYVVLELAILSGREARALLCLVEGHGHDAAAAAAAAELRGLREVKYRKNGFESWKQSTFTHSGYLVELRGWDGRWMIMVG